MKMVAASRLARAQNSMKHAKAYGAANNAVFEQSEAAKSEAKVEKILYIVTSSDRGLCGGIHSSVAKAAKKDIEQGEGVGKEVTIVALGDKPKQQLVRGTVGNDVALSFNQIGRAVPTFNDALAIADKIESEGLEFDKVRTSFAPSVAEHGLTCDIACFRSRSSTTSSSPSSPTRLASSRSTPTRLSPHPPRSPLTRSRVTSSLETSPPSPWPTLSTLVLSRDTLPRSVLTAFIWRLCVFYELTFRSPTDLGPSQRHGERFQERRGDDCQASDERELSSVVEPRPWLEG